MLTFLHGFLGSPQDWTPMCRLLDHPYQTLTLPGHQHTPCDLAFLEDSISLPTILIGYSLGGRLALQIAKRFPQKILGLILLSTHPGLEGQHQERLAQDSRWIDILQRQGMHAFLEQWYKQPMFHTLDLQRIQHRKPHNPDQLCEVIQKFSPTQLPSMWDSLEKFPFPLLFLFGEHDIKYKPIAKRLNTRFPVEIVPHCGHAIHLEDPALCAKKIAAFIGELNDDDNSKFSRLESRNRIY